ncbi:MAG TPA: DUF1801 domain-containing protein [Candidatus Limnocylindrales bacterium]|nr:DUF1801 domain-containing protein [Candidatus Limnocylindrales bacterium]
MPHVERLGSSGPTQKDFDTLLANHTPVIQETARALRQVLVAAFPEAVEQVDFGNKLLAVGKSMAMRDLTFAIIPHSGHVNLQLADGLEVPDPTGLVEGTGKRIRHVKVRSVEAAAAPALRAIVDAQVALRR